MYVNENNEIIMLFIYCYLFDELQLFYDFKQDIEDFRVFLECLEVSYVDEWCSYIRWYISWNKLSDKELEMFIECFDIFEVFEEYQYFKLIVNIVLKINDSLDVKVINMLLKDYFNKLVNM